MSTTLEYRGSYAVATRADPGPPTPESSLVDWWTIRIARRMAVHLTVRPAGAPRHGPPDAYAFRILGTLWTSSGRPVPDVRTVAYRWAVRTPMLHARDIARHLARNVAQGHLPAWPTSQADRMAWTAAVGVAEAFTERFGPFDDALREAPKIG